MALILKNLLITLPELSCGKVSHELSSTMESARLYMWQNPVGGYKMVRGAKWRETMKECTSARSIFRERGRERALLCAVAEP